MGDGGEGGGFGFAPRGDPVRKRVGRHTAVPRDPSSPAPRRGLHPSVVAGGHAPISKRPPWVWLLVGLLLGIGTTLLTSWFWLPEGGERRITEQQTSDDSPAENAVAAAGATEIERMSDRHIFEDEANAAADAVPAAAGASANAAGASAAVGVVDDEDEPLGPDLDVNPSEISDLTGGTDVPAPSDVGGDEQVSEPSTPSERHEPSKPPAAAGTREPSAAGYSPVAPEVALAALIDEGDPPLRPAGAGDVSGAGASEDADPTAPPATSEPSPTQSEPKEVTDRPELPPHIKQALLAAKAKRGAENSERLYRVQLAAVNDEAAARVYWQEVNQRLPGVFTDVEPIFDQREVDEREFLRIWVGAFDSRGDADGYCGWLKEQGQDCFVTRVDNL